MIDFFLFGEVSTAEIVFSLLVFAAMFAGAIMAGVGLGILLFRDRQSSDARLLTIVGVTLFVVTNLVSWAAYFLDFARE